MSMMQDSQGEVRVGAREGAGWAATAGQEINLDFLYFCKDK